MSNGMRVFWDVDTQKDFINPRGKLPVPKAMDIIDNLRSLTRHAEQHGILILGSVDRHFEDDEELKKFPPHCMDNIQGQEKIQCTLLPRYLVTYVRSKVGIFGKYEDYSNDEVIIDIKSYKQILFEKQHTDVFTNRNVMKFLDRLRVSEAVVYGVATEYCVKDAVLGLLKLGIKVYLVCDAIRGIDDKAVKSALWAMYHTGAKGVTTKDVIEGKF